MTNDQQKQLVSIIQAIHAGRQANGKTSADFFFVLNMKDQFAQPAIETYINEILSNPTLLDANPGLQEVLKVARSVRQEGLLKTTQSLPNQGA